ncbi:MAG TPA: iron-containing alcohol dehydrogenase [Polyangiaceae bacterium]|jgi:alcohol dehydrogenase class IV|nr:iron-containing alcohol dehydrogenase [Polyangiaceae bacterium]
MTAIWSFPTRIVFGAGVSSRAGEEAQALGLKRVLIVTDAGVERAGLTAGVRSGLEKAGIAVATYTGVDGNPTEENIEGGARAYADHRADGVIAIGGGSPMDAGKLIALRAVCALPFEQLDDAVDGGQHVPANVPPIIQIPTTAGTGSEVGRSGVLTVRSTQRKTVVFSPRLLARAALLDPELTRSMPPQVTAATGFDALTHCIEAYLSKGDHPMADAIALSGIEIASQFLERAVKDGSDMEARGMMMKAAMMGAVAFQKGLGACHSLAHPLSSEHGLHHGLANALCLPSVLRFNAAAVPDRVSRVAVLLGGAAEPLACAAAVADLRARVGLPSGLLAVGIQSSHLAVLADKAFADACHQCNPRDCTRADLLTLYEASL